LNWMLKSCIWIWERVAFLPRLILRFWTNSKPRTFSHLHVDEFPDSLKSFNVYLAGEGKHIWAAAMICPCGCKEVIELNLLQQARPCWSVQEHKDGSISLAPSIWRQKGCRSHFFLRKGEIEWC
jgi:hypothetical protein